VGIFAAIVKWGEIELIVVRKWIPKEKTSDRDKLGFNTAQSANELYKPHFIPSIEVLEGHPSHIYLVADGAGYHNGKHNTVLQEEYDYHRLEWLPNSPDLNPIENCWIILQMMFRKCFYKVKRRPYGVEELFQVAKEEWVAIPQETIDNWIDQMSERTQAVLDAKRSHTKR
jgi:transposase